LVSGPCAAQSPVQAHTSRRDLGICCSQGSPHRLKAAKHNSDKNGDVWDWICTCADTKLVPAFYVGKRHVLCAFDLMLELSDRQRAGSLTRSPTVNHQWIARHRRSARSVQDCPCLVLPCAMALRASKRCEARDVLNARGNVAGESEQCRRQPTRLRRRRRLDLFAARSERDCCGGRCTSDGNPSVAR
jgi:hypothetical protein